MYRRRYRHACLPRILVRQSWGALVPANPQTTLTHAPLAGSGAELIQLIRDKGVLWSTPGRPITGRDGSRADWMLYTYPVTLSTRGSELVADGLLPVLRTFASRQLVSVGYTAIPVMAACVMRSGGEFGGACIREVQKSYGSGRRIEGSLN